MKEKEFDLAALKKVGMIQQKQKEYFALRLRAVGGDYNSLQIKKIAEIADKYGRGELHLSTRQGIEIHNVHYSDLEKARMELETVEVYMGACGPRIRIIVACPGSVTCRWGIAETKSISKELDAKYFREDTPHKFKISVTGCPHNCAKATENDIGVMGAILPFWTQSSCTDCGLCVNICPTKAIEKKIDSNGKAEYLLLEDKCINCSICTAACPVNSWVAAEKGYNLFIGGTMGKIPRLGTLLKKVLNKEQLDTLIDKSIRYYQKNGRKKERFGHMIDRIGVEKVKGDLLNGI
ncbi:4Fe-4S binding protein [bacterium]|nr:4Fe-4S dicluster domain-containing protein [Candidatus Omnitrophota bacterium]MBU3929319.1 4Fe-4S binding protein [bacterium]MBU4122476.1 4Fe-4S binding protein [bacterium]